MLPWLDYFLVSALAWGGAAGYLAGFRRALYRFSTLAGLALAALFGTAKCALYLKPALEPVFAVGFGRRALPVGGLPPHLGPWGRLLALEAVTGDPLFSLIGLALRATAFCLIFATLFLALKLVEKARAPASQIGGLAVGAATGLFAAILFLTLGPLLLPGKGGEVLALATADSSLVPLLQPLVRVMADFFAFFFL